MKFYTAQFNPAVKLNGSYEKAIEYNYYEHLRLYNEGCMQASDVVVFPELSLAGYPPEDFLLRQEYLDNILSYFKKLQKNIKPETAMIVGLPYQEEGRLYNASVFISAEATEFYFKQQLPNFSVFDEQRYFRSCDKVKVVSYKNTKMALAICEDLWHLETWEKYSSEEVDVVVSINASPFEENKFKQRTDIMCTGVLSQNLPLLYINLWGGQDEVVFDGRSFVMQPDGEIAALHNLFADDSKLIEFDTQSKCFVNVEPYRVTGKPDLEITYKALVTGLKDYLAKHGCSEVLIGISGGVDSALVAAIACDAIGADKVHGIALPSQYTSQMSKDLAEQLSASLGFEMLPELCIDDSVSALSKDLSRSLGAELKGVAAENIQARMRGNVLMSISNQMGWFVLTTGNKSELSVGYATLYGDMNGGYNPIKDVYKTEVFELCHWLNKETLRIPELIITRPPSAELAEDQKDSDSLPAYPVLDAILKGIIERSATKEELIKAYTKDVVLRVESLLERAEYKRRQAAPGTKITGVAFGRDYRMPL